MVVWLVAQWDASTAVQTDVRWVDWLVEQKVGHLVEGMVAW